MNIPYKCPVCQGRGIVPAGFYEGPGKLVLDTTPGETCKACAGKGILWGYDFTQPVTPVQPYVQPAQPFQPWQPYYPPVWPYGGGTICSAR